MFTFIAEHIVEVIFGLISAGALAACKHFYSKMKKFQEYEHEEQDDKLEETIEKMIEPIREEVDELRQYILKLDEKESDQVNLIIASYRFRLIQLCKLYSHQGYMTVDQYDQLSELWKVYSGLGGNGQGKEYYEKAMALEIRDI